MKYLVSHPTKKITTDIYLSTSKSISNRLLIIRALAGNKFTINNISDSDDTCLLRHALDTKQTVVDIGHAGTAMRFLTAYFSCTGGERILTGSERMKNRPIGVLVDALRSLGADIQYIEKDGYPPLKINGRPLSGNYLEIDGSISSQFITALLMIAPVLPSGLTLCLKNKIMSRPYILLTLSLMKHFGINYLWQDNTIKIPKQKYDNTIEAFTVEADWSAASYWYEIASLSDHAELTIYGLNKNSLQGDSVVASLFKPLGVETTFFENKIHLTKKNTKVNSTTFSFNFIENPDIAQTMAVTLASLNIPFYFEGLETLKIKETDRIEALKKELSKLGIVLSEPENGELTWNGKIDTQKIQTPAIIATYNDHRMAMAYAPAALKHHSVAIENPLVVTKSYPNFWKDLEKSGFKIVSF